MQSWSNRAYLSGGANSALSEASLHSAAAAYAEVFAVSPDLVPVLTLGHLAKLTSVNYYFLRGVVSRERDELYTTFLISKRGRHRKETRRIVIPEPRLMRAQAWINRNLLMKLGRLPNCGAYQPGSSIFTCASQHAGSKWLIKIDIKSFFSTIKENRVFTAFRSLGLRPLIAFELTRICTMVDLDDVTAKEPTHARVIARYSSPAIGSLPMGAPSSPMLSNLVMRQFDRDLAALAAAHHCEYSRYADDIFLSSLASTFRRADAANLAREANALLFSHGFIPNSSKFSIVPPGARKVVLGLVVNEATPRLSREFKSRLRQHYYYINRLGALEHASKRGFSSLAALERHLDGLLSFAASVDRGFAATMRAQHNSVPWPERLL